MRIEKSTSLWLDEGIGGLSNQLDGMRWTEARLEKVGAWMGFEEREKKNLDNFFGIFGCKGKKSDSLADGRGYRLEK